MNSENETIPGKDKPVADHRAKQRAFRPQATIAKSKRATKSGAVIKLLSRPRGATIEEMMKATGWQAHSVRGFLAGTVKKKQGRPVTSEADDRGRIYRIAPEQQ
ncbi:DUF3489 domain-containing protein [Pelagerythrobacter sp.]|uniref:DUF3489 domain-containing protein n=1 Tax=Pelagerythrobacter sp. TaxID=2800702 RepID=UPI0035AEB76F